MASWCHMASGIWSSLVQVMAFSFIDVKQSPKPVMTYCQLHTLKPTSLKFESNMKIFVQENTFENVVWKMAVILSQPHSVHNRCVHDCFKSVCLYVFQSLVDGSNNAISRGLFIPQHSTSNQGKISAKVWSWQKHHGFIKTYWLLFKQHATQSMLSLVGWGKKMLPINLPGLRI